jgi:hypothetical protein
MARPLPSLRAGLFVGEQAMPKVPWHLFQDRQPRAHLVVGAIVQAEGPAGLSAANAHYPVLQGTCIRFRRWEKANPLPEGMSSGTKAKSRARRQ